MPKTKSVPEDAAGQPYSETPPTGTYRIKWKGKTTGEMPFTQILEQVESGELGMLAQIETNGAWLTLREFLANHERSEKERLENEAREVARQKRLVEQAAAERAKQAQEAEAESARQNAAAMESRHAPTQAPAQAGLVFCRQCGNQVLATAAICMKCGSPIGNFLSDSGNGNSNSSKKSRTAYVLLGIFLGYLGIHNFYAGYTGRGIAQLLLCICTGWMVFPLVILFVWTLMEVITITQDANGNRFS